MVNNMRMCTLPTMLAQTGMVGVREKVPMMGWKCCDGLWKPARAFDRWLLENGITLYVVKTSNGFVYVSKQNLKNGLC